MASDAEPIRVSNFLGMDLSRNLTENREFDVGQLCVNQGRQLRSPLHPRFGLAPVTSDNGNHDMAGVCYAMGSLATNGRLSLIMRLSGGRMVAATNVSLE